MKNGIIGILVAIIYRNICITQNSDTFAIMIGAVCMAGCVYFLMREVDKWSAGRNKWGS